MSVCILAIQNIAQLNANGRMTNAAPNVIPRTITRLQKKEWLKFRSFAPLVRSDITPIPGSQVKEVDSIILICIEDFLTKRREAYWRRE